MFVFCAVRDDLKPTTEIHNHSSCYKQFITVCKEMSAKNKEAQSGINRFLSLKNREAGVLETNPNLRPKYVQKEQSLPQADRWRSVVVGEISSRLTKINDPAANDYQIRDLNDELNKLYKEKRAWEYHIRELGGADYIVRSSNAGDGNAGLVVDGYRYFGRAKELPDIKKLLAGREETRRTLGDKRLQKQLEDKKRRARDARLDDAYYGKDEGLFDQRTPKQSGIDAKSLAAYEKQRSLELEKEEADEKREETKTLEAGNEAGEALEEANEDANEMVIFDEDIPTSKDVEKWLVARRKKHLLAKLAST